MASQASGLAVDRRGAEDRLHRRPRQSRRHHARLRRQRQQRPAALRMDRPLRHRRSSDDLSLPGAGRRAGHECLHGPGRRALRSDLRARAHFDAGDARGTGRWNGPGTVGAMAPRRKTGGGDAPPRIDIERLHVTRSRANPGGKAQDEEGKVAFRSRKPPWLKVPAPGGPTYRRLKKTIEADNLHTVCQEANCPNVGECWERGTATFMILGDVCTRRCGFCNVQTGKPTWHDALEPLRVANQVKRMGLQHAVITSVDRDDLPDYGAGVWCGVIRSVRMQAPWCKVECLTPDFRGEEMPLAKVIAERPDVFNHNVEVVPRLYPVARRGSRWERSLRVLRNAKAMGGDDVTTKSGLMVGLGETHDEIVDAFGDLREHGVQVLTVGQYLRPTERHLPVVRYWEPEEFTALEAAAMALGFEHVAAGPLVRSSYHADEHVAQSRPGVGPLAA